jgi:hypothetical protein
MRSKTGRGQQELPDGFCIVTKAIQRTCVADVAPFCPAAQRRARRLIIYG